MNVFGFIAYLVVSLLCAALSLPYFMGKKIQFWIFAALALLAAVKAVSVLLKPRRK